MNQIIKKINQIGINKENLENLNYDDFIKLIQNKDLIILCNKIINIIIKKKNNSRYFLSIFLIKYHNTEIFEFETDLKQELIKNSNDLVDLFYNLNENNLNKFNNKFKFFKNNFIKWKKQDKESLVELLIETYNNISVSKEELINKRDLNELSDIENEFLEHYDKQQESLKEKIITLGGLELLNKSKKLVVDYDDNFKNHIKFVLEDCYWKRLLDELNSIPKKYEQLLDILVEIKQQFINLFKNNKEILNKYNTFIDLDLFKQQIENDALDSKDIYQLMINICNLLKEVQSKDMDEELDKFIKNINIIFKENKFNYEFLVEYFKFIFNYFDLINNRMELFNNNLQKE
tara:strand:- start:3533 stop:4573 length:1041 start_codon:yes stop_codon:yes gene_type:complete